MDNHLSPNAEKVQNALRAKGLELKVVEMPQSTRTALEAAQVVGCQVGQIVKSLVFKAKRSGNPVMVLASGQNRVNEKRIEELIKEPLGKADADFVRQQTGFAIGGVPPVAHAQQMKIFIDEDLLDYDFLWAAAGTPHAVFQLTPADLVKLSNGNVINIK